METIEVASSLKWRSWLRENHLEKQGVWLVFRKKKSAESSISYGEALDEALAYGWIDSLVRKLDEERYARKFTPRRPGSIWSTINIERVRRLAREGRITSWGLQAFENRTGEISLLEKVNAEGMHLPKDLIEALRKNKTAWAIFQNFTPSYRKRYLVLISGAKRTETRKKRVEEAVVLIARNVKAPALVCRKH